MPVEDKEILIVRRDSGFSRIERITGDLFGGLESRAADLGVQTRTWEAADGSARRATEIVAAAVKAA